MMPFDNLKKMFPNIQVGDLETFIPMEDIVKNIIGQAGDTAKDSIKVVPFPDGIKIEIDLDKTILNSLRTHSPNSTIEPNRISIFIPKEDIIAPFKVVPNVDVEYTEKGIIVKAKPMI